MSRKDGRQSMGELKARKLRNGAEEVEPLVVGTMLHLKRLYEEDPIALYELREKSRDPQHELWGHTAEKLQRLSLIGENGQPHESIRNIVNSAINGEMLDMRLQSPFAENDTPPQSGKGKQTQR